MTRSSWTMKQYMRYRYTNKNTFVLNDCGLIIKRHLWVPVFHSLKALQIQYQGLYIPANIESTQLANKFQTDLQSRSKQCILKSISSPYYFLELKPRTSVKQLLIFNLSLTQNLYEIESYWNLSNSRKTQIFDTNFRRRLISFKFTTTYYINITRACTQIYISIWVCPLQCFYSKWESRNTTFLRGSVSLLRNCHICTNETLTLPHRHIVRNDVHVFFFGS